MVGKRESQALAEISRWGLALLLAGSIAVLPACGAANTASTADDATEQKADADVEQAQAKTDDAGEEVAGEAEGADEEENEASFDSWAEECTDRYGSATVYAVSELKGWQLETLLQQQEYEWDERNHLWLKSDGSAALAVHDAEGHALSDDAIAELGPGSAQKGVSYRLVTSRYASPKRAFNALASDVMTCEDSEFTVDGAVGIVSGPTMRRSLVFASMSDRTVVLTVVSEGAVKEGLFNRIADQKLGKSLDATFERLTGRKPGSEQ